MSLHYFSDGKPPAHASYGEERYRHWVRYVLDAIGASGQPYPLHIDEDAWVNRAVAEGIFALVPDDYALVLGAAGPPPPTLSLDPFQVWTENVTRCLQASPTGEPYAISAEEREWAERAIRAGVFEWQREPSTIRLPGGGDGGGESGPYR